MSLDVFMSFTRNASYFFPGIWFTIALGVAILTSNSGAAAQLGNLYYATWVGFLISCMIVKSCWLDFQIAKYMNDQSLSDSKTQVEMSENNNLSVGPQIIIDDRHANVAGDDDI